MVLQQTANSNMQMDKTACLFAIFVTKNSRANVKGARILEISRFDAHVSVRLNQSQTVYGVK